MTTSEPRSRELVDITDDPRHAAATVPPLSLPVRARVRWALQVAQLAPSIHNTQPWRWHVDAPPDDGSTVELRVDLARHLPALDPDGRQQEISCGCALGALLIGASAAGLAVDTELVPPNRPGVLARVRMSDCGVSSPAALERLSALRTRRSARGWFSDEVVPPTLLAELARFAALHGVTARRVGLDDSERDALEHLTALATLHEYEDERIPVEVQAWTREAGDARRDGVPSFAWERTGPQTAGGALILRDFAGEHVVPGRVDAPESEPYPELLLLSTPDDGRVAHLHTGLALLDVLLVAERAGFAVGHVNQVVEDRATRLRLAHELDVPGAPQLLLRIGRPQGGPQALAPRRPVSAVLDPSAPQRRRRPDR
ncbi:MAG TPA: hypothetical protein VHB30_13955 [Solirubrobacteraceae bacterium]|nr:hypothetical protein [Solirubrobacteraceae bacterium]